MSEHVVHHVEMCVIDSNSAMERLTKFGFSLFAKRRTPFCTQLVAKLGSICFVITERLSGLHNFEIDPVTTLCCANNSKHELDTVHNLAFRVKENDVKNITERISGLGGKVIKPHTKINSVDGSISYSVVKSICGNTMHTLISTDEYKGNSFYELLGFEIVQSKGAPHTDLNISQIDHVTFACYSGVSESVIKFYENCFGMTRFEISSNDDEDNGLILADGVGLRLRAMEYWRCAEIGLKYSNGGKEPNTNAFMLVVVESLPGETNCNIETFLKQHGPGIEHLALRTSSILQTVQTLVDNGVRFRRPPRAYYEELRKTKKINEIGELDALEKLGILLDNEADSSEESENTPKYLMQIFSQPLFDLKTFFIEIIERFGNSRGLGAGNIIALVRSIREEEKRKVMQRENNSNKKELNQEDITSPRRLY